METISSLSLLPLNPYMHAHTHRDTDVCRLPKNSIWPKEGLGFISCLIKGKTHWACLRSRKKMKGAEHRVVQGSSCVVTYSCLGVDVLRI